MDILCTEELMVLGDQTSNLSDGLVVHQRGSGLEDVA